MSVPASQLSVGRDGVGALGAVVLHGVVSFFAADGTALVPWGLALTAASAVYLLVGVFTVRVVEQGGITAYLVVQTLLGAGIVWLGRGHSMLAPLPVLVPYVLSLPRAAVIGLALAHAANVEASLLYFLGSPRIGILGAVVAGGVFVIAFTELALRERRARDALAEAHAALAAHAAQTEELAIVKERNRLARELHDTLGHYLTVVHVHLQAAERQLERDTARARAALGKAIRLTHEGIDDVRRSVSALRTAAIDAKGLVEALTELTAQAGAAGTRVKLRVEGEKRPLSPAVELALFRTAQEALTNVRKHSGAGEAGLVLTYGASAVRVEVADAGVGAAEEAAGFGLRGLRERAALLGGELAVSRGPGFTVTLSVPYLQPGE